MDSLQSRMSANSHAVALCIHPEYRLTSCLTKSRAVLELFIPAHTLYGHPVEEYRSYRPNISEIVPLVELF